MIIFCLLKNSCATTLTDIRDIELSPLEKSIIKHEGVSPYVYKDTGGIYTLGIGKNIDKSSKVGLQMKEMVWLMRDDIQECKDELRPYRFYKLQDDVRKDVLIELCYNMGLPRLLTFKRMRHALIGKDYELASYELLLSKWATQVGKTRSNNLYRQLKTGTY